MNKVLFITYMFPPLSGAGVWRNLKYAKYLSNYGWKPIIISADESINYEKDYSLLKEIPEETNVFRISHKGRSRVWQYIRTNLKLDYDFPDTFKTWFLPAYKLAKEILLKEHIDLIYSSSAPFISHFVAMKLKQEFKIPWVADFRDPWTGNDFINQHYTEYLIKPLRKYLFSKIWQAEDSILNIANKIIVVTWKHKQQLYDQHEISSGKIKVITNGYNEEDFREINKISIYPNKIIIIYAGSIYTGYAELISDFLDLLYEIDPQIEVVFIGKGAFEIQKLHRLNLTCIANLPKEKFMAFSLGSDFSLLTTLPSAKWNIPGKTFDYLRLGKPILALVPEDGDAAKIIKETNTGFVLSYDRQKRKGQLENILKSWKEGRLKYEPNWENITKYEVQNLTQEIVYTFNEIISN